MKKISILGSTGSIGTQALSVVKHHADSLEVCAMSAGTNYILAAKQVAEFSPRFVAMATEAAARELKKLVPNTVEVGYGEDAITHAASYHEADTIVNGISGFAGTKPLLASLEKNKTVALANKESIVCAHSLVDDMLTRGGRIIPVDSEQSAIFQCLQNNKADADVSRIILTASGGAFREYSDEQLKTAKAADALNHPTWNMGAKITIDSATLFNKGLEIMEASYLFGIDAKNISVLIHKESVVHSMVEFSDNSIIAQLSAPDMRLAIQYALFYPNRERAHFGALNLAQTGKLSFSEPDYKRFPALELAYAALEEGNVLPIVYNGANEAAVARYMKNEIDFYDISDAVEYAMAHISARTVKSFEDIISIDCEARALAEKAMVK